MMSSQLRQQDGDCDSAAQVWHYEFDALCTHPQRAPPPLLMARYSSEAARGVAAPPPRASVRRIFGLSLVGCPRFQRNSQHPCGVVPGHRGRRPPPLCSPVVHPSFERRSSCCPSLLGSCSVVSSTHRAVCSPIWWPLLPPSLPRVTLPRTDSVSKTGESRRLRNGGRTAIRDWGCSKGFASSVCCDALNVMVRMLAHTTTM